MADLLLGGKIDPATSARAEGNSVLPTSELTTHGVIIGMTGSGKTGLGVVLIEECLNSGVPALLIDPKGDLTNLCLIFPELAPTDFRPWVNEGDAQKAGLSLDDFAAQQAQAWKEGLEGWGITQEQLRALRSKIDFTIYTPGSSAGRGLNIVGSLQAPAPGTDLETISDEIDSYVTSLLGMLGINADPLSSREHILLANLIQNAWSQGQNLDLPTLLGQVQQPPIRKLGVLELDSFFPPNDRMAFAMKLNGLLASPSFGLWIQGDPIDIQSMLYTPDGRPRCAIVTTAHLSDEQRQSVTSLVLSKMVTWMRRQSGTSDLRALLYMDEVAGYLPPTANPPTKKPIMLMLKQARAFGLGLVLSTQNPVDLDYKALSNAGTWLIGRLQTEQDKKRLVDGLTSAAGGVDARTVGDLISNLGKRQFLFRRASKDVPEVMTTRWAMSYLRGPLTREQIGQAMGAGAPAAAQPGYAQPAYPPAQDPTAQPGYAPSAPAQPEYPAAGSPPPAAYPPAGYGTVPAQPAAAQPAAAQPAAAQGFPAQPPVQPAVAGSDETPVMPPIAPGISVNFLDPATPWLDEVGGVAGGQHLRAGAIARINLRYDDDPAKLVYDEEYEAIVVPLPQIPDGRGFVAVDYDDRDLVPTPPPGAVYGFIAADAKTKTYWTNLQRALIEELLRSKTTQIMANLDLKTYARLGESREEFEVRCKQAAAELAEKDLAALRTRYATKLDAARKRASDAQITAGQHFQEYQANYGLAATVTSVVGSLLGGRSTGANIAAQAKRERAAKAKADASAAKANVAAGALSELELKLQEEVIAIDDAWQAKAGNITMKTIPLEKNDITVTDFRMVWVPVG